MGVALIVAGVIGWFVARIGTDTPWWDQWDVEGRWLYPALIDGNMTWADWFRPHNEHRILWTHLLNATLFSLNGQWDPRLQQAVGIALRAIGAGLLVWLLGIRSRWFIVAVIVAFLPLVTWHNALWGFQSSMHFVFVFGLIALGWGAAGKESGHGTWWMGVFACVAAIWSVGAGFLVPLAWLTVTLVRAWEKRSLRSHWADFTVCGLLAIWSLWLQANGVAEGNFRADSFCTWLTTFIRMLAWPHSLPMAAIVLNVPVVTFVVLRVARRLDPTPGDNFALGTALWSAFVAAAVAYSRANSDEVAHGVPSRYVDLILLLPLVNLWMLLRLLARVPLRNHRVWRLLAPAWGIFLFVGWLGPSTAVWNRLVLRELREPAVAVHLLRAFQLHDDRTAFSLEWRLYVPHPNPDNVRQVLDDPRLRSKLPPSLQPDLPMGFLSRVIRATIRQVAWLAPLFALTGFILLCRTRARS